MYIREQRLQQLDFIILGGGASGLQLAYRLSNHTAFENASILILESNKQKGNDRTWCYWETGDGEWDDLLQKQWKKVQFKSKNVDKIIDLGSASYKMLRSKAYYDRLHQSLVKNKSIQIEFAQCTGFVDEGTHVTVSTDKQTYRCSTLFNSAFDWNVLNNQSRYPVLQQHFLGWYINCLLYTSPSPRD